MRQNNRPDNKIREVSLELGYLEFAHSSAYIEIGKTRVIATASVEDKVPPFLKGSGTGWINAEYSMLPGATEKRNLRDRVTGRISGRSQEIQRLIGRSLRAVTDLSVLGEKTIIIDCDVIQADGGTRCASITAGCVALASSLYRLMEEKIIPKMPMRNLVAAVSVGIVNGQNYLDLDYQEDSNAEIDMNVVETDTGQIVEIQATAEKRPFSWKEFTQLTELAASGIKDLIAMQKQVLKTKSMLFIAYGQTKGDSE
ncbi:MAG: ribonuclease PH [Candidatus Aminicenantes bacterium]|nr:ribonuclease PH [Candidatus Aminicenantes bacterium]